MTYQFPESLIPLRNYLRSRGFDGDSIKTSRQAAFVAQQLLGTRVKFPPQGSDMTPTLQLIQKKIPSDKGIAIMATPSRDVHDTHTSSDLFGKAPAKKRKGKKGKPAKERPAYLSAFSPDVIASGYHIFADGACIPNPGPGGWGFAV